MKSFIYKNIEFKNLHSFCKRVHFNYNKFKYHFLKNNKNLDKTISKYLGIEHNSTYKITINEKIYDSIIDFCNKNNVKENTLYVYLKRHNLSVTPENIEKWFNGEFNPNYKLNKLLKETKLKIDNLKIGSIYAYFKKYNLEYTDDNLQKYINKEFQKRNWDLQSGKSVKLFIYGKEYKSLRSFCRENNISHMMVYYWLKQNNLALNNENVKRYIDEYKNNKYRKFIFDGIEYKTLSAFCKTFNLNYIAIKKYLYRNNLKQNENNIKNYLKEINYENLSRNK